MKTICLIVMLYYSSGAEAFLTLSPFPLRNKISISQQYTFKLIEVGLGKYGYEIYSNNKIFIRQVTIPAIPGNNGFQRKADAEKVAKLVITKLSNDLMPTVEKQEMDKLHIEY